MKKYDRRKRPTFQSKGTQRGDEQYFEPVEKILWEFERTKGTNIDDVDTRTIEGKRLGIFIGLALFAPPIFFL